MTAVYVLATLVTTGYFMADTADYVDSIIAHAAGRNYDFWEFGHLFWRPLGWMVFAVFRPVTSLVAGAGFRPNVSFVLVAINWLAGLISVCALFGILRRLCARSLVVIAVIVAFIFSHGFLNFTQTGSSYIPGLALLLLGFYVLIRSGNARDLQTALLAGLALAGAVCLWFPYVLALPAAVVSPLLFSERLRWRLVIATGIATGIFLALAYGSVVVGVLGIHSVAGFKAWMSAASHDTDIRGLNRMVFGFARSFIYMGNDGMLFKRYLLHDPFNPVTAFDLLRLSLWKLALFYLFVASVFAGLLRSAPSRRILILLILNVVPVILFAISFDGGAIERYLPLYPVLFISLCVCLCGERSWIVAKYVAIVFMAAMVITNLVATAKPVQDRRQQASANRISDVVARLKPNSRILAVNWQDDLVNFSRSYPFHQLNRAGDLRIGALVTPGTTTTVDWRQGFATQAEETWSRGGDMWVSQRAFSPRPLPDWNWAEGDEKRVSWPDFQKFFSQLELGEAVGGPDGFVLILPTEKNREFLQRLK
ncbi:MAG: hypothetical protein V7638_4375 [Acidobacteriota bacterium]